MNITLLDLRGRPLALQETIEIRQVVSDIVGVRYGLETQIQHFSFAVAEQMAERTIDAQPRTLWRHERHADSRIIKGVAKMLFGFAQRLADAFLLSDVAV